jgi:hypothetical protein
MNPKYKSLSRQSLAKTFDWAESNHNALSRAYLKSAAVADALTRDNFYEVASIIRIDNPINRRQKRFNYQRTTEIIDAHNLAYELRDTIGRIILDMLNREKRKGSRG